MIVANVSLWGSHIGSVAWDEAHGCGHFEYTDAFLASHIEPAPFTMPLAKRIYQFPGLAWHTFRGLPGLLADSLPDKFGNAVIDAWLAREGRDSLSFTPVERLCYLGDRGMGALEFSPSIGERGSHSEQVEVSALVGLANAVLTRHQRVQMQLSLEGPLEPKEGEPAGAPSGTLQDLIQVGVSAGGARAKAILAWNETSNEVRSGQVQAPAGFGYWLMKFDGVGNNRDKELADPQGYGLIEYAYSLMAGAAGITMTQCRLFHEGGRSHFMTRRFDRDEHGGKLHMQSLCALGHYDFNQAGAHGYEQALVLIQRLGLGRPALEEQYRRMVFNVLARNQDDHSKNIAFLMDKAGKWSLAPAYDLNFSYNPQGQWTHQHQMTVNGKRDRFELADLLAAARSVSIQPRKARDILAEVSDAVMDWNHFAKEAGVDASRRRAIGKTHRFIS